MDKDSSYDSQERAHPTGVCHGNGVPAAWDKKQPWGLQEVSVGRKEFWWELLTRHCVRAPGVGHHSAAAQARWHKSHVEHARISHECAQTLLLLGLCTTHPVIQLPWKLLAPRTPYLGHCKLSVRDHKGSWALLSLLSPAKICTQPFTFSSCLRCKFSYTDNHCPV